MDAKEFRIGNLVKYKGNTFSIIALSKDDIVIDGFAGLPDNFNGIPLNKNWLLMAYFKKMKLASSLSIVYECDIFAIEKQSNGWYLIDHDFKHLRAIKFFHQLQNVYFSLTGKELEFKM